MAIGGKGSTLADVIDLFLQQGALRRLEDLLDTHGLAYFLRPGGGDPILLDEVRLREPVAFAAERLGRVPIPSAREACYRAIRRRLAAYLAEAMVQVGS